eukprot:augustus_masked-scaffold_2-processed-gene-6.44-mRNA-1 protein AED:0.95 eAED:1.00 QI:0/-1/0/1/-1/1/1/0/393
MKPAIISIALFSAANAFTPVTVDYTSLQAKGSNVEQQMLEGLTSEGLFAVSGIPGFQSLKQQSLIAASRCALSARGSEKAFEFNFQDGTKRHSLAGKVEEGEVFDINGADLTSSECLEFSGVKEEFRSLIDEAMNLFIDNLDAAEKLDKVKRTLLETVDGKNNAESFKEIKSKGLQLEHFHTYVKPKVDGLRKEEVTMKLHVDQGLFIALTPALMIDGKVEKIDTDSSHGFKVQLASGELVEPSLNNVDLLFMVGDGVKQWVNSKLEYKLRAVPHSMSMPVKEGLRSWYGRMVLPRKDAFLGNGMTFNEIRAKASSRDLSQIEDMQGKVCSYGFELVGRDLQETCPIGEIWCWMQCMPLEEKCKCPSCRDTMTGELCPLDEHNMMCAPACDDE